MPASATAVNRVTAGSGAPVTAEPWSGGLFGAPTVTEAAVGRRNNFTILRLVMALLVVVSHGFSVILGNGHDEPLVASTGLSLGSHAVNGFFVISGYLVTMSFDRRGWRDYILARALRIAPGLIVATFAVCVLLGAALSTLGPIAYLRDPATWDVVWRTLTSFKSNTVLPGVYEANPYRMPLGTVWTLKYEVMCYAAVFVIGVAGLLRSRRLALGVFVALTLGLLLLDAFAPDADLRAQTMLRLPMLFAAGALLYRCGGSIRLSLFGCVALVALTVAAHGTCAFNALMFITTAYVLTWLALVPVSQRLPEPKEDISYGVYLYGWPVQQTLHALFPALGVWALLAPSLALSALVGLASWRFVEKPALNLKRRLMP